MVVWSLLPQPKACRQALLPSFHPPRSREQKLILCLGQQESRSATPPFRLASLSAGPLLIHLALPIRGASGKHQAKCHQVRPSSSCTEEQSPCPQAGAEQRCPVHIPHTQGCTSQPQTPTPQRHIQGALPVCQAEVSCSQPPHTHLESTHMHTCTHAYTSYSTWALQVCPCLPSRLEVKVVGSPGRG